MTDEKSWGQSADQHQDLLRVFAEQTPQILNRKARSEQLLFVHPHLEMFRGNVGGFRCAGKRTR